MYSNFLLKSISQFSMPLFITTHRHTYIFVTLALLLLHANHVTPGKIVDLMNVHDQAWESHLEQSLVVLESNCHENDIPFNREKVKEDLTSCLHPIITQQLSYNINFGKPLSQETIFRHIYIEPVCNKISSSISCLKPHKKALETCIREDGKAVSELMKFACKNNGSILADFVDEGGIDCIIEHKDLFSKCIADLGEKTDLTNSSAQVCEYFREVRDCSLSALSECKKPRPVTIIRSIFEDVNKELSGQCLAFDVVDSNQINNSGSSSSNLEAAFVLLNCSLLFLMGKLLFM